MKKIVVTIIILLTFSEILSQETGKDTYTIQRLIIFNDDGEILLQEHANGWMTPALRHNTSTTIQEGLSGLASNFGLEITNSQLQGIFMYFHSNAKKPSFRQHFSAKAIGGTLKIPEGVLNAKWFHPQTAIKKMLDPQSKIVASVGEMTQHIINHPDIIWGGSYLLIKKEGIKTKSKLKEDFYPIGEVQ